MSITHAKVSAVSDGGDTSLVRPSDWNAAHEGGLLYADEYRPGSDTNVDFTSTASAGADIDATNLIFSFVAPPSGRVMVELEANLTHPTVSSFGLLLLRDGSGQVAGSQINAFQGGGGPLIRQTVTFFVAGLTPGTTYNWRWGGKVSSAGTASIYHGPSYGGEVTKVWAA